MYQPILCQFMSCDMSFPIYVFLLSNDFSISKMAKNRINDKRRLKKNCILFFSSCRAFNVTHKYMI